MAIISLTIENSTEQIVVNIPRTITITTNIPSIIYYTLDGSEPHDYSLMYTSPIVMPTTKSDITLKVYATNGVDSSAVISQRYLSSAIVAPNPSGTGFDSTNARLPHSATTAPPQEALSLMRPFGSTPIDPNPQFLNPALTGDTVYDPSLPAVSNGYDGYGNPGDFTNKPFTLENYSIEYSTTNFKGETGPNIGTLPAETIIERKPEPPEESTLYTSVFDPRASVIFQDVSKENPEDPPQINRQFFSLEKSTINDGNYFFNGGQQQPPPSGSFIRNHFNPKTNMMTYYYYDNWACRWIISSTPYDPNKLYLNLGTVLSSGRLGKYVLQWIPYGRRSLF